MFELHLYGSFEGSVASLWLGGSAASAIIASYDEWAQHQHSLWYFSWQWHLSIKCLHRWHLASSFYLFPIPSFSSQAPASPPFSLSHSIAYLTLWVFWGNYKLGKISAQEKILKRILTSLLSCLVLEALSSILIENLCLHLPFSLH